MELYKIRVKTLEGNILTFRNVNSYINEDGLIKFIDSKTGIPKVFSSLNVEIEVQEADDA